MYTVALKYTFSSLHHLFSSLHHLFSSPHHLFSSPHHLFSSPHHLFSSLHHLFSSLHHLFKKKGVRRRDNFVLWGHCICNINVGKGKAKGQDDMFHTFALQLFLSCSLTKPSAAICTYFLISPFTMPSTCRAMPHNLSPARPR